MKRLRGYANIWDASVIEYLDNYNDKRSYLFLIKFLKAMRYSSRIYYVIA